MSVLCALARRPALRCIATPGARVTCAPPTLFGTAASVPGRHCRRWQSRSTMAAAHGHEAKRVLVPIAEGSEDLETACLVNVLRRAKIHGT
ncbi:hypothetical protein EON67_01145 [archaeon]|nr:MAG: hypothetical protein EON67_01145 [archaeon]